MRILFFLGNGFDLNLGMKTSYQDFYRWYLNRYSSHPCIDSLKRNIDANYENWSDLECGLGEYSKSINTQEDALCLYRDLTSELSMYLSIQERELSLPNGYKSKIIYDMFHPNTFLRQREIHEVFSPYPITSDRHLDIITFNYTNTLEQIGFNNLPMDIQYERAGKRTITRLIHLHGFTNERMVLGVRC